MAVLTDAGGMFGSAFSSPIYATLGGKPQLVVQTRMKLAGVEPESGKVSGPKHPGHAGHEHRHADRVGQPDLHQFLRRRQSSAGIKRAGDEFQVQTVWKTSLQGYMSTPVIIDGHAYLHLRSQRFTCVDLKTGKQTWNDDRKVRPILEPGGPEGPYPGPGPEGELLLIRATPDKFDLLDSRKISDEETWGHLAVCGDQVFIRELNGISAYRWQ